MLNVLSLPSLRKFVGGWGGLLPNAEGDEDDVALVGAILDVSECCGRVQEVSFMCQQSMRFHSRSLWVGLTGRQGR